MGILLLNAYGRLHAAAAGDRGRPDRARRFLGAMALSGRISSFLAGTATRTGLSDLSLLTSLLSIVVAVAFFAGIAYAAVAIPAQTQLQEDLPEDVRGRVFGVLNMLVSVASFLPILVVGPIADLARDDDRPRRRGDPDHRVRAGVDLSARSAPGRRARLAGDRRRGSRPVRRPHSASRLGRTWRTSTASRSAEAGRSRPYRQSRRKHRGGRREPDHADGGADRSGRRADGHSRSSPCPRTAIDADTGDARPRLAG